MRTKMKCKAIIGIAMIVAVLASVVGVVSAADESEVVFKDQGYTVIITFPNGEGIAYNGSKNIQLYRDSCKVNLIRVLGKNIYKPINVSIEVVGVSVIDWSLSKWRGRTTYPFYYPVSVNTTTNEFTLGATSSNMPSHLNTRIYRLKVGEPYYEIYFLLVQVGETLPEIWPTTKGKETLTLKHYPPFPYLAEKESIRSANAPIGGDLEATLKDEDGKCIQLKKVLFYVEPGTNLYGALKFPSAPDRDWIRIHSNLNVPEDSYIGYGYTSNKGVASINYISSNCIRPSNLSKSLIREGKVEGTIKAVVVNDATLEIEYEASVPVNFMYIAKIVKILGDGQPDFSPKREEGSGKYEYTVSGPGRVRVKRVLVQPQFDYKPVEEGFELMPGDIINIDGGVNIEIVWVNANRVIAKVPKRVKFKTGTVPIANLDQVLMATAYESGFHTDLQKWTAPLFGLTISKGIDLFISNIPVVGPGAKFLLIDIRNAYKEVDLSEIDLITRIRIRSKVIVDQEGDEINVYTIEGSPDIKTVKGEEVTLADKEMVPISAEGSLSEVQSFDPEKVLNEFYDTMKESITINAETASTVERETVKLVVTGVAGDGINVAASPLSDDVVFKAGIDDTPMDATNQFNHIIDADGTMKYAVEFTDTGSYTIEVTVIGPAEIGGIPNPRVGDTDTVDITVSEKEVPRDLPAPTPSKLEIAELFTSKSVYPKGEKVDVHYYITNIGTVDVYEYHVEYDIIDAKGKTVDENVGGAHSISAGDENKWHSEKWEIPSNAEFGPYTVKATLKWDSKTDTETTDFFVTLATKTEDPRAELEIAELYTSKSAYLKGENVKVCYHIKNVGTVDVDEYHVIYEISGVDSEKICWFILSPHRIAAGEKQKWCPTGELAEWKIPSNAESGTHTVEATLIWGTKTVEKKTAFLVKPN